MVFTNGKHYFGKLNDTNSLSLHEMELLFYWFSYSLQSYKEKEKRTITFCC